MCCRPESPLHTPRAAAPCARARMCPPPPVLLGALIKKINSHWMLIGRQVGAQASSSSLLAPPLRSWFGEKSLSPMARALAPDKQGSRSHPGTQGRRGLRKGQAWGPVQKVYLGQRALATPGGAPRGRGRAQKSQRMPPSEPTLSPNAPKGKEGVGFGRRSSWAGAMHPSTDLAGPVAGNACSRRSGLCLVPGGTALAGSWAATFPGPGGLAALTGPDRRVGKVVQAEG